MGLGKTLQTLALICHARERGGDAGPFLVVAPTSVVPGWAGEAARFTAKLSVQAVTDTLRKSRRTIDELGAADVVVTTYTLLRLDARAYGSGERGGGLLHQGPYVQKNPAQNHQCV